MAGQYVFPFPRPLGRLSRSRASAIAPRVSPAALRVPDPRLARIEIAFPSGHPQIFVHEGARQALERRLALGAHRPVFVSVTDNRRNMISYANRGGVLRARVHHMFLDAPADVQDALPQVKKVRGGFARGTPFKDLVAGAERDIILAALDANDHHVSNTARELQLERSHLYKKMRALGIDHRSSDESEP